MSSLRKHQPALFLGLVAATWLLTTAARMAVAQCGPGQINSCKYGTGTPCSQYASVTCGTVSPGVPCPNNGALTAYYWKPTLYVGDWYRCTAAGGGYGACTEALQACMTMNFYQFYVQGNPSAPGTCANFCGTGTYLSCTANNGGASVCGTQTGQ